jgi:hypothetical protein
VRKYSILIALCSLFGCADGRVDIIEKNGEVIGECSARFYWHWYGAQDSVDYMIYICAKEYIDKGLNISDASILKNDYTLPKPPEGQSWNKKTAFKQFDAGNISEQKYGYILAAIEYEYILKKRWAKEQLDKGNIDSVAYEKVILNAKQIFHGE